MEQCIYIFLKYHLYAHHNKILLFINRSDYKPYVSFALSETFRHSMQKEDCIHSAFLKSNNSSAPQNHVHLFAMLGPSQ
uniref:Uncharacterized protein n=1 Tax=Glycine max TaxID=3847 RepID=K7L096_SOYBN